MSESNAWDFKRVFYRERIKRSLVAHFSAALVTSDSQANYLESLGMPAEAIYRGYNAVDNEYFKSAAASAKNGPMPTVNDTSLPEQFRGRYFLASARLVPKKNLAALIRGFEQFRRSLDGGELCPPLVILGDGELRAQLENLTQQLGLERDILFAGFRQVDELPTFYGTAGAFIHVSTTEQWGLVVNEAMASGLPVAVSTRCGCAEVLVEDGHTGYLLDPFDENDICRAFRRLHGSERRDQLARRGQDRVFEWGPERFARGLKQAAEHAARVGVPRVGLLDMLTLRAAARG
jgi:glycosyltransferase involved in cell wall biosynthesis